MEEKRGIDEITVGTRFRRDLGDLTSLKQSIANVGLLHPVVINPDCELITGHRRLEACRQLGWDTVPVRIVDLTDVIRAEHDENVIRKDFLPSEMVAIARALEPVEREAAKERQREAGIANLPTVSSGKFPELSGRGQTRDKVASYVGVSGRTLEKAAKVVEAAEREPEKFAPLVEEMDSTGKVDRAYRKVRQTERNEELARTPPQPLGVYDVILADPPWRYEFAETESRAVENQYPTMDLKEIKALKVPSAENAALFLWATAPKLPEALEVMGAWGFSYRTCAVWDKEKIGMGYWFRGQHELLLVGVKGDFAPPAEGDRFSSVIRVPRTSHSRKPECVYDMLERMFPNARLLELFSRHNSRSRWAVWGNEVA